MQPSGCDTRRRPVTGRALPYPFLRIHRLAAASRQTPAAGNAL
jgi:hypothetical protein